MARSIQDIKNETGANYIANDVIKSLYGLEDGRTFAEQFSVASVESIVFYVVSVAVWAIENLFDTHREEITNIIDGMKPHSLRWYASKSKEFQYGRNLPADSDIYNNSGLTPEQVENSKIVAYASAVEVETSVRLRVAKDDGNDLSPLSEQELQSFSEYMSRVKDAGVRLTIESRMADTLNLSLQIFYNPLVLEPSQDGKLNRIDGAATDVVTNGIRNYLKNLPFNGILVLAYLEAALREVEGVVIARVLSAQGQYGNVITDFDVKYAPDAGYIRLNETALNVVCEAQSVI